jgi:hypothetical protein
MIIVHHLSRVTDKERRHVCTIDEQRKSPVDKVGIHGDLWSEVRNRHSRQVYLILTQPAFSSDAWVSHMFALVQKKALFGWLTFTAMDFHRPLVTFRRKNKEEAAQLHAQLRGMVMQEKEDAWCAFLPAPHLLKGTPRRHSPHEASMWRQTLSHEAMQDAPFEE